MLPLAWAQPAARPRLQSCWIDGWARKTTVAPARARTSTTEPESQWRGPGSNGWGAPRQASLWHSMARNRYLSERLKLGKHESAFCQLWGDCLCWSWYRYAALRDRRGQL